MTNSTHSTPGSGGPGGVPEGSDLIKVDGGLPDQVRTGSPVAAAPATDAGFGALGWGPLGFCGVLMEFLNLHWLLRTRRRF